MNAEECSICFEELYKNEVVALYKGNNITRVCSHYFHKECVLNCCYGINNIQQCPLCRSSFAMIKTLPDPRIDSRGWFDIVDSNHNGTLSIIEVSNTLRAQLPLNLSNLEIQLKELWPKWTTSLPFGEITYGLLTSDNGLLDYILTNFPSKSDDIPPDIRRNRAGFFYFWDKIENGGNNSGELDKYEIIRAFVKTFSKSSMNAIEMKMVIEILLNEIGYSGNFIVTYEEFNRHNGLADMIIRNLNLV